MKAFGVLLWTGVLSILFFCVGLITILRAQTPRGVERPLAVVDLLDPEVQAKRISVLSQRVDALMAGHDLLKKDFDAFRKDTDVRFTGLNRPVATSNELPEVLGLTPSWFVCSRCPAVKKESESEGLPFKVTWMEVTEEQMKAMGIPNTVGFPCFYWQDAFHKGWYCHNDGSMGNVTTMKFLEAKWREHR